MNGKRGGSPVARGAKGKASAALAVLVLIVVPTGTAIGAEPSPRPALEQAWKIAREVERQRGLPVSGVTTTSGVATLELFDPVAGTGRTVPTGNGIHFTLCGNALRRCRLPAGAARTQALALARRTLRETSISLVVVALPQSATRHLQLVFERDVLESRAQTTDRLTQDRLYAMAGLITIGIEDSLVLMKLGTEGTR